MSPLKAYRNLLALLAVALLLSGCQQTISSKLAGTWKMAKAEALAEKVSSDVDLQADGSESPQMTLHFKSSGILETITRLGKIDSHKKGAWKLLQKESGDLTKIECSIAGVVSQHDIRWVDDSTIRLAPPNMSGQKMILKFVRAK